MMEKITSSLMTPRTRNPHRCGPAASVSAGTPMSLFDHANACHRRDMTLYRPFIADGMRIGWVHHALAERLEEYPDVFAISETAVTLVPEGYGLRTGAVAEVVADLYGDGLITGWRNETFPVAPSFYASPLFEIERAAVKAFGIRFYCVQLNGLVGTGAAQRMWIGRRSRSKEIGPGKLDQIVGGGVPLGMSLADALVKEAAEEAGMAESLIRQAHPVGATTILAEEKNEHGLWNETLFNYDLILPEQFKPVNADGEVESFELLPVAEVRRVLETSDEFLFDAAPVIVDCLMRHGHIAPEEPDYVVLAELLAASPEKTGSTL
jgi:8-oxo-dGTP pyrophosphatase MutT (NUDIX family)